MIHPRVLGSGTRMFPEGGVMERLELVEFITTTTGVILAPLPVVRDG